MLSQQLQQLKDGDKNIINALYSEYSKRLYRFAYGYLKTDEDARDIVQEVFVRLWNSRHELKNDTQLDAFLFTVAKNTIISTFRKRISEKDYLENLRFVSTSNPADTEKQVDYAILAEKVKRLTEALPEQRRRIFILSKEKGFSNKAIAEELEISVKTVEDHMTKARKFIRENLKEYGFLAILFWEMFVNK